MDPDLFNYTLPTDLIAHQPLDKREDSRLMLVDRKRKAIDHYRFSDLPIILPSHSLLVKNNTQVLKARLQGRRQSGGRVEILLSEPFIKERQWIAMLNPSKRLREDEKLIISSDTTIRIEKKYHTPNTHLVRIESDHDPTEIMNQYGTLPLPPYIKADQTLSENQYQTTYASQPGAIAAPTAGLHFSKGLIKTLELMGITSAYITLHVGLGTFQPIKESVVDHVMHSERYWVDDTVAKQLTDHRMNENPIIAVGTTVTRTLQTVWNPPQYVAQSGDTALFIKPGDHVTAIDGLITNFHLPRSTLLLLVSAFVGEELMARAYKTAIKERYRFYSFGDAMIIL